MLPRVGSDLVDGDEQVERLLGRDPFRAEL
jgi:hypothetical protein